MQELCEGDLAFRKGTGAFSRWVTIADNNRDYSHIGVVFRRDSEWVVVHAVPGEQEGRADFDRVKAERLDRFFDPSLAVAGELVHTPPLSASALARMRARALGWARDSVRFDHRYDMADTSTLYCTELAWSLFLREGIDLSEGRRTIHSLPLLCDTLLLPDDLRRCSGNVPYYKF